MVVEHARAAGVRRLVFTSSREVYGDPEELPVLESAPLRPKNAYGMSKVAGEMCCAIYAGDRLEIVVLRLANVYGPGDWGRVIPLFVERALRGEALTIYGGSQILDFVHVSRVIDVLMRAAFEEHVLGPVNVGSGKGTSIAELADRVLEITHSTSRICVNPSREMEVVRFVADIARARQLLGFAPPEDPLHGLAEQVERCPKTLPHDRTPPARSVAV
jgi:UDP-glucose 4-epimerase